MGQLQGQWAIGLDREPGWDKGHPENIKHPLQATPILYLDDFGELIERVLTVSTVLLSQLQDVAIHTG